MLKLNFILEYEISYANYLEFLVENLKAIVGNDFFATSHYRDMNGEEFSKVMKIRKNKNMKY